MRSTSLFLAAAALGAQQAAAHATFQELWINGVDYGSQCVRLPASNNPVQDVTSTAMRCNVGASAAKGKCSVAAGTTVSVEMHQQPGDRSCSNQAIGGDHHGPVQVYLSKVSDAATADGSSGWFKIFADTWAKSGQGDGDSDYWGTKDLNACCGKMNVKIPSDIAAGDYLMRAEALALHTASSSGQAQFYMSCYQLTITGGGSATPATVNFPGAYKASDPGILVNIHQAMSGYTAPGPNVYSGGSQKVAGSGCSGCESSCKAGSGSSATISSSPQPSQTSGGGGGGGGGNGCSVALYGQCGGQGYTGCTTCASGSCKAQGSYYSQCTP